MNDEMMVSIVCNTYNHEEYIAQTLEGFVMQKTDFKFEILVHDDASTDNTANIIREYEKKYPDIIKPIYQTENQYSKGIRGLIGKIQYGRAKGKYIALCEGDDYWLSDNKLQKQVDFLEKNPEYSLCIHSANYVNADTGEVVWQYPCIENDSDISVEDMILYSGECIATNSMLYRRELRENYPDIFRNNPVGDYPLAIYLVLNGKVRCLSDVMSVYRVMAKNSWSSKTMSDNKESKKRRIAVLEQLSEFLKKVDEYSGSKYHKAIKEKINVYNYEIACKTHECYDREHYIKTLKNMECSKTRKIKMFLTISVKQTLKEKVRKVLKG